MSKPHNTHYMYTYIHTDYTYTHTYLQTNTYIHQYMHVHTDTPHPPTGGGGILYIHTYILTYKYIHTSTHACTYRHAPPTHRGGGGKTTCPPYIQKPVHPDPLGGGGGWGLQTWTIYISSFGAHPVDERCVGAPTVRVVVHLSAVKDQLALLLQLLLGTQGLRIYDTQGIEM